MPAAGSDCFSVCVEKTDLEHEIVVPTYTHQHPGDIDTEALATRIHNRNISSQDLASSTSESSRENIRPFQGDHTHSKFFQFHQCVAGISGANMCHECRHDAGHNLFVRAAITKPHVWSSWPAWLPRRYRGLFSGYVIQAAYVKATVRMSLWSLVPV
ncbi:hypothetical protein QAD02_013032 [Eretmocerus hayati]|uniref:Uncharacterized protein n=1 Tax=Eretmocerus hayati TaxID=131215 RepID=A0ACC2P0Z7_9HYME|nr:hypothetical protein QAD02_013032 [Eretmocerus hayati]